MDAGYRHLPPYYDRWQKSYGKDFSTLIFPKLLATIRAHRIPGATMLDVACGTGTLAALMARRGWEVTGIDASEGMIREASAKAASSRLRLTFLRQDMRELAIARPVHLATSFFDSLNHLMSGTELQETFRRIRAALIPRGWFVFDTSTERCFTTLWTKSETIRENGFSIALDNAYDPGRKTARCNVTIVVSGEGGPLRLEETVRERYYTQDEIAELLTGTGFTVREGTDFNFTSNPAIGKLKTWWVAEAVTLFSIPQP